MFPGRVEILEHDGYHVRDDGFLFQTGTPCTDPPVTFAITVRLEEGS